jgi:dTDP-glucose 4,6-dehydratase
LTETCAPAHDEPVLVTGAAGFIGSWVVRALRARWPGRHVVSLDALSYAGDRGHLEALDGDRHTFVQADVADREAIRAALQAHRPSAVLHLAAESHVDRSILDPLAFLRTNVQGTVVMLQEAKALWGDRQDVRFVHVSTDEVYGSAPGAVLFDEDSQYRPSSPYSASKAAADHFALAWHATYGLPVVVTNCSNNYGPRQFPEKLIPVVIDRAHGREPVPIYGRGDQVRDWLFVGDHAQGLLAALERGTPGRTYCFGGDNEWPNLALVEQLLDAVDVHLGRSPGESRSLISFITDRPGHDQRYAISAARARAELGWVPTVGFEEGLARTVAWYLENREWVARMRARQADFEARWYAEGGRDT